MQIYIYQLYIVALFKLINPINVINVFIYSFITNFVISFRFAVQKNNRFFYQMEAVFPSFDPGAKFHWKQTFHNLQKDFGILPPLPGAGVCVCVCVPCLFQCVGTTCPAVPETGGS